MHVMKSDRIQKTSRAYIFYLWKLTDVEVKSRMAASKVWEDDVGHEKEGGLAGAGEALGRRNKFNILWHSRAPVVDNSLAFQSV